jgi:hypothetical protein
VGRDRVSPWFFVTVAMTGFRGAIPGYAARTGVSARKRGKREMDEMVDSKHTLFYHIVTKIKRKQA